MLRCSMTQGNPARAMVPTSLTVHHKHTDTKQCTLKVLTTKRRRNEMLQIVPGGEMCFADCRPVSVGCGAVDCVPRSLLPSWGILSSTIGQSVDRSVGPNQFSIIAPSSTVAIARNSAYFRWCNRDRNCFWLGREMLVLFELRADSVAMG